MPCDASGSEDDTGRDWVLANSRRNLKFRPGRWRLSQRNNVDRINNHAIYGGAVLDSGPSSPKTGPSAELPDVPQAPDQGLPPAPPFCKIALVNISGMTGMEAAFEYTFTRWAPADPFSQNLAAALQTHETGFRIKDSQVLGATAKEGAIENMAMDLLESATRFMDDTNKEDPSDIALVFVARGLGGSVLKQALLEASKTPKYLRTLQSTALLVFAGTPHRSRSDHSWTHMLSKLFYAQFTSLDGPWLPQQLQDLSAFHEDLEPKFRTLLETRDIRILSIYQEAPVSDEYELLAPKTTATLDYPAETRIGLHRSHQLLAAFQDSRTKEALVIKIEDVRSTRHAEYGLFMKLVSNHGLSIPTRRYDSSEPVFRNLCDWLLLDDAFTSWLGAESPTESLLADTMERAGPPIQKALMILELGGAIRETTFLSGSLIASLQHKMDSETDCFITLAHHHPQALPLTKTQLMASLCRQILAKNPRFFSQVRSSFKSAQKALQSHNSHSKDAVLWRILKTLFGIKSLGHTFIIFHQPPEVEFSQAFLDLIADITSLAESMEIHCKMLVVRLSSSSESPSQRWPVLRKFISNGDQGVRMALESDFAEKLRTGSNATPDLAEVQTRAFDVLLRDGVEFDKARILTTLIAEHALLSLNLLKTSSDWETGDGLATLIFDLIPKAFWTWVGTGLLWVTHAARPLTLIELSAVLALVPASCRTTAPPPSLVNTFAGFLYGLVEVDAAGTVFVTCPETCRRLLTHVRLSQGEPKFLLETESNSGIAPLADGHAELAVVCLTRLHEDSFSTERSTAPPLRRYAVEHWLTHLKLSGNTAVISSVVANFVLADENRASQWIQQRALYWASDDGAVRRDLEGRLPPPPRLQDLASELAYDASKMTEVINLIFRASAIQTVQSQQIWYCLALSAAQTGESDVLRALDKRGHLEEDAILNAISETGSRNALQYLADNKPAWIRKKTHKLAQHAIRFEDFEFVRRLQDEFSQSLTFAESELPLIYDLANNERALPSDRLWEELKSGVDYKPAGGHTVLHVAAGSGHIVLLPKLLAAISEPRVQVNCQDTLGLSPLHLAAAKGLFVVVEQLLVAGALVDPGDKEGHTPLHLASAGGHAKTVRVLLCHDAFIGSRNEAKKTPLHLALQNGHLDVSMLLLDKLASCQAQRNSVNLDAADREGFTALALAVSGNLLLPAVRSLLRLGASLDSIRAFDANTTPLHMAVKHGSYEAVEELLGAKGINVNACDNLSRAPLHWAAELGRLRVMRRLLDKNAAFTRTAALEKTPLSIACEWGNISAVKMLLPSFPRDLLNDAYMCYQGAWRSGSEEILSLVLDAGANKNAMTNGGSLHWAARNSHTRVLKLLLARRVDLELRATHFLAMTALTEAVHHDSLECVKLLVDAGADIYANNIGKMVGRTPLFHAANLGRAGCLRIMLGSRPGIEFKIPPREIFSDHHTWYDTVVDFALADFSPEVFLMLLEHLSVQSPSSSLSPGPDVLLAMIKKDEFNVKKISILLERVMDWDPNKEIGPQGTLLHYAAYFGRLDLTLVLIQSNRVEINVCHDEHGTPLETAVRQADNSLCTQIVKALLDKGADATIGSSRFGSPLHAAAATPDYMWMDEVEERYLTMAQHILERDPSAINLTAGVFGTPLAAALGVGAEAMVYALLKHSPNIKIQAGVYGTVLHALARRRAAGGLIDVLDSLLDQAAPEVTPETPDAAGRLPIHLAAAADNESFIWPLTTPEVPPLAQDVGGRNALHFAAASGSRRVAIELLAQYPDAIDIDDKDGWKPLHWACRQHSAFMIKLLLQHKANKRDLTKRGWEPIDVATYHGFDPAIIRLVKVDKETPEKPPSLLQSELTSDQEEGPTRVAEKARSERSSAYRCDSCVTRIYGPRYRCSCHGLDLCFKCIRLTPKTILPDHQFELFDTRGEKWVAPGQEKDEE